MKKEQKKQFSLFNRFYRVMIVPGLALFLITSYINLTGSLQPYLDPAYPTGQPLLLRLAGAFLFGPISIGLGWMITRRFKDNLIGPVLIHWGCATSPNLGQSIMPPLWYALSLYYSMVLVLPGMVLVLASFPSGRGVTPFWDRVMKGLVLGLMGYFFLFNLTLTYPVAYGYKPGLPGPLAIEELVPLHDTLDKGVLIALATLFLMGGSLTIYRYWITYEAERKQMRWLLGIALFFMIEVPITNYLQSVAGPYGDTVNVLSYLLTFSVPSLGISLAIWQHRLWDIDVIIRRTLQYSVLTGLLGVIYYGSVVVLQGLFFGNQTSEIAIVLSTLLIAGLFNLLRRRIQDVIDRRFYRKKYDAAQVLANFTQTCQNETDMEALTAELLRIIQETLQPRQVTIWLKPTGNHQRTEN